MPAGVACKCHPGGVLTMSEVRVGSFYGNVTLLGVELIAVRSACQHPAFVLASGGDVVVYTEGDDDGPRSGEALSAQLGCVAVSVGVQDDDILFWQVHDHGQEVTSGAVPDPADFFDVAAEMLDGLDPSSQQTVAVPAPSVGELAESLVRAVGRGDVEVVRAALSEDFVFAHERHQAVVDALTLSRAAVGWGFRYLSEDDDVDDKPPVERLPA